jgi:L-aspartate oxidase
MPDRLRARFLVLGSGIAGLHTAWRAADHGEVLVLTKRTLFDSSTAYAQGGIAAALGAGDSPELHRRDTLAAGAAL